MTFDSQFSKITETLHDAPSFEQGMQAVESLICDALGAERMTVYCRGRHQREIVSRYQSGGEIKEICVPLSPASIAGFVAMSKLPLNISDAYDEHALLHIHEKLRLNKTFDQQSGFRTKAVLAVPMLAGDTLLGVFQAINKRGDEAFRAEDVERAEKIAKSLAQRFRYELNGTCGPYDYLVQTRRIKPEQLEEFTARAQKEGADVAELLIQGGSIARTEIGGSLEHYYQVPFRTFDAKFVIPQELLKGISAQYLRQQFWVPLARSEDDTLTVLIDNPNDAGRVMEIQRSIPAKQYAFEVALREDIVRYINSIGAESQGSKDIHALVHELASESEDIALVEGDEELQEDEATIIQLVNRLIADAYTARASDIHIEPAKGKNNAAVRIRVDGSCRQLFSIPHTHVRPVVSRIKIISGLDISERRKPQDGKCALRHRGQALELRVATLPTVHGEGVVMRILASSEPLPLEKLQLSEKNLAEIIRIAEQPHGIFLVVGPTGSGKTTTLHAVLGYMNTPERKIWTAEDPVEITQAGLNQVQMQSDIGLTFASALRSFLRADPDVIMIGEMRDHETAHIGVEASLTGHFVLSTLHTNSAPETLTRLLDLGLDPVSFADAVQGVLAQRLVRTLCDACKKVALLNEEDAELLRRYYGEEYAGELQLEPGKTEVFQACGCERCGGSGYYGRVGVHELLVASPGIKSLIYRRASAEELKKQAQNEGMRTLLQDGIHKLLLGKTDMAQVRRVVAS